MSLSSSCSMDSAETDAPSTSSDLPDLLEDDGWEGNKRSYWDWPLNEDGMACAEESRDTFRVTLDFGCLHRPLNVKRFEDYRSSSSSWTVGLSPVPALLTSTKTPSMYHWRLEIEILRPLHMILIDANREIFRNDKGRTMKKTKKMYRIPQGFDMDTLRSEMTETGNMIFEVRRHKSSTNPPLLKRSATIA